MPPDRFAVLADELILEIVNYLSSTTRKHKKSAFVDGRIRPLASCNKRLRRIILPLLYQTVKITKIESLDRFLSILIESPAYARLVREFSLEWYLRKDGRGSMSTTDPVEPMEESQKRGLPEGLTLGIKYCHPWANALLVLHLLQNLETLNLEVGLKYDATFDLWLIRLLNQGLLSHRLRKVTWYNFGAFDAGILLPLFLLPSIAEIDSDVVWSNAPLSGHWSLPPGSQLASHIGKSNVKRLGLYFADVLSQHLATFLQLPRALKALIYQGQHSKNEYRPVLDNFRRALDHAARSLEYLDINWDTGSPIFDGSTIWSFQNFTCLRTLYINYDLIYNFDATTVPGTARSLPPNLEILAMHQPYRVDRLVTRIDYFEFWTRLLDQKSPSCLKNLRFIAHLPDLPLLSGAADLARDHGVEAVVTKHRLQLKCNLNGTIS
jgi:hypothetical protein